MSNYSPRLVISKTNGENEWVFELTQTMLDSQYVIGRSIGEPDIPLGDGDDDELCISKVHCLLIKKRLGWHIRDCSVNGTYLVGKNGNIKLTPEKDYHLLHYDEVLIQNYRLRFEDPAKTRPLLPPPPEQCPWVFNVREEVLYRVDVGQRSKEHIAPTLKKILVYMAKKNIENGKPYLCSYEELSQAVWETGPLATDKQNLNVIAQKIRNILSTAEHNEEKNPHRWLECKTKMGYILKIDCE